MFKNLKRRRRSYLRKHSGRFAEQDDSNYYRCGVCGFICNSDNVVTYGHQPNRTEFVSGNTYPVDSDGDYYVDISSDSCPNCGSYYSRK